MRDIEIFDLIHRAVNAAVQRAVRSVVTPRTVVGSVVELDRSGKGIHEVMLDGDAETVAAMNLTGFPLFVGSRVTIMTAPPHQFWIIGNLGRCVQSGTKTVNFPNVSAIVFTTAYPFPFGGTPEVFCSVSGAATGSAFGYRTNAVGTLQFDVIIQTVDGALVNGDMAFQWMAIGAPI